MSNKTYDQLLREVSVDLREQIEFEQPPDPKQLPKDIIEQRFFFKQYYCALYVRYLMILRKLEECYDQMLQPQKREDVKRVLEAVIVRFLKIRSIIIQLWGEFVDMDDVLIDLKQTPEVLEIPVPRYYKEDDEKEIKRRDILMNILLEKHRISDQSLRPYGRDEKLPPMSVQDAILIIQTCERGRQGRQSAKYKRDLKKREERVRKVVEQGAYQVDRHKAAILVQKLFKGYMVRKKTRQQAQEELEFLGMVEPQGKQPSNNEDMINKTRARRKLIQTQNKNDLSHQRIVQREKILKEEGPRLKEDLHDAILEKLILYRQTQTEKGIPEFPSEEAGGSKKFMLEQERNEEYENQKAAKKKAKKLAKKAEKQKGGKKKKKKEKKKPEGLLDPPEFKYDISNGLQTFVQRWHNHEDDGQDFTQKYDADMLRDELMTGPAGIEEELRKQVDQKIREELENLKAQMGKAKKGKKKGKKKKKKKKKKGKKGKKKKKTEKKYKSTEPFLSELVSQEIAQKFPSVKLFDYHGDHKVLGSIQDWLEPSMGQVRQLVGEVALSLGSKTIHEKSPHCKALMIYGPERSGKTMLARAIATEIGATWFDLSPETIAGKYEGIKDTASMVKMVFEVAKDMQPAVIYVDEIEKVFKATKKKSKIAPTRIKKELLAQMKALKPGTRVLFVGNTSKPWECEKKETNKFFSRFVYTVIPDYGSCQIIWKKLIERKIDQALPPSFDLQTLAYISNGYASGSIYHVVHKVLSDRRIKRLDMRPLSADEFIGPLSKIDPVFVKKYDKLRSYCEALPLKYRKRVKKDDDAELEALKKAKEEKKGKKAPKKKKK